MTNKVGFKPGIRAAAAVFCCLGISGCATRASEPSVSLAELYAHPALYDGKSVTVRAYFLNKTDNRYLTSGPGKHHDPCLNVSSGFDELYNSGKANKWVKATGVINMAWGVPPPGEERLLWLRCVDDGAMALKSAR